MSEPLVSVIVTSYRRPEHLERAVAALQRSTRYPNLEYILCDDGTPREEQDRMRDLPFDVFVLSTKNQGLGTSLNRGLRLARGEYIFYVQDDQLFTRRHDFVESAVEAIESVPGVQMVFVRPNQAFQRHETAVTPSGRAVRLPVLGQPASYAGIYVYSQKPHLKTKRFHEQLGYFREDVRGGTGIEDEFCRRFLAQTSVRIGALEGYEDIITDIGMDISYFRGKGRWRQNMRSRMDRNPGTRAVLRAYDALPEPVRARLRRRSPRPRGL